MEQVLPMALWAEWGFAALVIVVALCLAIFNLPGNTLMLVTCIGFAFMDEARYFDIRIISAMILFYVFGEIWEFCVSFFGIKREKVSWTAVFITAVGTLIGTVLGTMALPVLGSVVGGVAGAFCMAYIYEYLRTKSTAHAYYLAYKAAMMQFAALVGKLVATTAMAALLIRQIIFFQ